MFKPVPTTALAGRDLIPQAIISRPISHFAKKHKITFVHEHDDLDEFDVAALQMDNGIVFALKHYSGYPQNTTTIYLPDNISNVDQIAILLGVIADELQIPQSWFVWQRADDPEY